MRRCLIAWPEILFIDGTYKITDRGFTLLLILVEDSNGKTELVAACLLAREDEQSMRWFLQTFRSENETACLKVKTVMTDKDMTERKVIREVLPDAQLRLCAYHVLKAFSREVGKESTNLKLAEKNKCLELFSKMVKSESLRTYNENYLKFRKEVPKTVLSYFDKNWHPIKQEWSKFGIGAQSFFNDTNNRVESFNGHLKKPDKVGVNNPMDVFFTKFFKFEKNRESEIDIEASKIFNERLILDVKPNDPLQKYCDLLTPYAFNLVKNEIQAAPYLTLKKLPSGKRIVPSKDITYTPDLDKCNCLHWISYGLPCCHIFAFREACQIDLYDPKLCLRRWTREYYKAHQRVFQKKSADEQNLRSTESDCILDSNVLDLLNLPEKHEIVGRPSKAFDCTLKIPKTKVKVYKEKTDSDKAKTLLLWLGLSDKFIARVLKSEIIVKKVNLTNFGNDAKSNSFKDEEVSIEVVREYFDTEAFEFLSTKVDELRSMKDHQCKLCQTNVDETRFLRCHSCLLRFHLNCCHRRNRPPANKSWFCKECE